MLATGTRLGPYEILAPLGAGGMGEVYRARDTRLGRDVAIKALPVAVAQDPERLARFDREAKLLASLSHPNIGAIYGLEEVGGQRYLVLEFIEGETLGQRLTRGPLPVGEALEVCSQIASALEAAHESGVVHRDLKPGNVMRTPAGVVKVLDFGLAKGGSAGAASDPSLSASPTLTYAATSAGMVLGTAAYMSPEQARGRGVDKRSDIWSFGCVLYECLTGRQAFQGETVSDLIARILEREPEWGALPATVPSSIRELLQRCLEKDARQRLRDIGDARITIERERALGSGPLRAATEAKAVARRRNLVTALAALGIGVLVGAAGALFVGKSVQSSGGFGNAQLTVQIPDSLTVEDGVWNEAARGMALLCQRRGETEDPQLRVYVRTIEDFAPRLVPGTDGVTNLRVSSDGRWIVFRGPLAANSTVYRLARVPLDGSAPPVTLVNWDPRWNTMALLGNGDVLTMDNLGTTLWRIPANGGAPVESKIDNDSLHASMGLDDPLPGDRAVFMHAQVYADRGWSVQAGALELATHRLVMFGVNGGNCGIAPGGELLFSRGEVLLAAPFDANRLKVLGPPVAVASGLLAQFSYIPGFFTIDRAGTLVYVPGGAAGDQRRIGIIDADGRLHKLPTEPKAYQRYPVATRDAKSFVIPATNAVGIDEIWVGDMQRAGLRRIVDVPNADCTLPCPTPDQRQVAYWRIGRDASDGIYVSDLETGGEGRRVIAQPSRTDYFTPEQWSPSGEWLLLSRYAEGHAPDIWAARFDAARDSVVTLKQITSSPAAETAPTFSRDGRWLAYHGDESGRLEIYIAPFRDDGSLGSPMRLTDGGGTVPEWVGSGKLAYRSIDFGHLFVMDVGDPPTAGPHPAREWANLDELGVSDGTVMSDGTFLAKVRGPREKNGVNSINFVFGWSEVLKRRLAAAR
jgi:serine/threonine-protein kinase